MSMRTVGIAFGFDRYDGLRVVFIMEGQVVEYYDLVREQPAILRLALTVEGFPDEQTVRAVYKQVVFAPMAQWGAILLAAAKVYKLRARSFNEDYLDQRGAA